MGKVIAMDDTPERVEVWHAGTEWAVWILTAGGVLVRSEYFRRKKHALDLATVILERTAVSRMIIYNQKGDLVKEVIA